MRSARSPRTPPAPACEGAHTTRRHRRRGRRSTITFIDPSRAPAVTCACATLHRAGTRAVRSRPLSGPVQVRRRRYLLGWRTMNPALGRTARRADDGPQTKGGSASSSSGLQLCGVADPRQSPPPGAAAANGRLHRAPRALRPAKAGSSSGSWDLRSSGGGEAGRAERNDGFGIVEPLPLGKTLFDQLVSTSGIST